MRRSRWALSLIVVLFALASARSAARAQVATEARLAHPAKRGSQRIQLAVTVDDLPAAGDDVPGFSKGRILSGIMAALQSHRVPGVVGFFNGSNMDKDPATSAALQDWLSAGFLLGNHTYSHLGADEVDARAFEQDIERDQAALAELEKTPARGSVYFRYPYLERGAPKDDVRIRRFLLKHGYRIADVSVDFDDWAFSAAYVRCLAHKDEKALDSLSQAYLDYALAELLWSEDSVRRIVGRAIPHVLLIHADVMTAQKLAALLTAYEKAGVEFISLKRALADPIYQSAQTGRHGDTALVRTLVRENHARLRSFVPLPSSLLESLCP